MRFPRPVLLSLLAALAFAGAARAQPAPGPVPPDIQPLLDKPLYRFTEAEVGRYLAHLQAALPDLRRRIVHLARKNLGQPYELYLLGEMPFEAHDPQPLYSLAKSDCVVFAEHTYAMALSRDWTGFMRLLQRIRYRDGRLGVATRNHFTEADWNPSNAWLARDITEEIGAGRTIRWAARIDRAAFLQKRYQLALAVPPEDHRNSYLPFAELARADAHLREGDFVNVVRGVVQPGAPVNDTFGGSVWVGHVGLVTRGPGGELMMIHSAEPAVREETLAQFIARETEKLAERDAAGRARLLGFKFLRLEENPWANLRRLDGDQAPRVTLPDGAPAGL